MMNLFFLEDVFCGRYHRKQWQHWIDEDRDCKNTRQELLISRSLEQVTLNSKNCVVLRGKWRDYYYNEILTTAREIDVDHLVPLKHAHDSGGEDWTRERKKQFANDPENLVLTNKKYNRMKGSKGIAHWLPVNPDYACKYVADWIKVKKKYQLFLRTEEKETIQMLKEKCTQDLSL